MAYFLFLNILNVPLLPISAFLTYGTDMGIFILLYWMSVPR